MNEYPSKPQETFGGTQHDKCDYVDNPQIMASICKSPTYGGHEKHTIRTLCDAYMYVYIL